MSDLKSIDQLSSELNDASTAVGNLQIYDEATKALEIEEEEERRKRMEMRKDPHGAKDPSQYGVGENLTELKNAVVGGLRDSASSILTAPERLVDMATGEMADQIKEAGSYVPDFNPLGKQDDIATNTWWGGLIRGGIHFGSLAIPIVGWAGRASKATGVLGAVSRATVANPRWYVKGASVGAVSDLVSEYSQDANGLQVLRDRYGFIDTPITTKDTDHPALKTVKNMVEGLGIGTVFEGVFRAIGKSRARSGTKGNNTEQVLRSVDAAESNRLFKSKAAADAQVDINLRAATARELFGKGIDFNVLTPAEQTNAMTKVWQADAKRKNPRFSTWTPPGEDNVARAERKIEEHSTDVENQTREAAQEELKTNEVRGHSHKPVMPSYEGNPNSTGKPFEVGQTLKRIYTEWGAENGSTDGLITSAAAERLAEDGFSPKGITPEIARELLGDARFKQVMADLQAKGRSLQQVYGDAFERFKEVLGGRDAGELEPNEFWGPIRNNISKAGDFEYWSVDNVLAADLITESLFKQLRDRAMVAREILDITDLNDVDGPLKFLRNNLIVGMEQVKRSKFLTSPEYSDLISTKGGSAQVEDILDNLHLETRNQVDMMFDVARQSPSDEFLHALVEAFSMSDKVTNWQDFDGFMRQRLFGRTTEQGVKETGALIRELQGVMVNSILSGPKTPLRAILGTSTATFVRPVAQTIGASLQYISSGFKDAAGLREALAEANAMVQAVPESFELFKSRLNSYWAGDISTIKTRFSEFTNSDQHWQLMENWAEGPRATTGEQAAFRVANLARSANQSNFLTYSTKLMAATDDAFTLILARGRSRSKALRAALDAQAQGLIPDINPELIRDYQHRFYEEIFDVDSATVKESWLKNARAEVTLTKDLSGFGKAMDKLFSSQPLLKPFYLFARTGINGLDLTIKHTPGFNFLVKEFNDIAFANPKDLSSVVKYGIETVEDLRNARALQNGRLALGSSMIFMASQHYLNGNLTGNGPADVTTRRNWLAAGWVPRSIKLGNVWVSHESLEPFTSILSAVADLGDNQRLMGDEWVEKGLLSHALIVSKAMISKTYLQGMTSLTDLFGRDPKALEKIAANILNNQIPLAGLRNEIGKVINPHMKELNSGFMESLRNRNLFFDEVLGGENELPTKYDILTGAPINDWNPFTRIFNAISPIHLNFDQAPGRKFLFRSNYDLGITSYTAPDGTSLRDNPGVRSLFQQYIGDQDLEGKLAKLALRPDVQRSLQEMEEDLRSGRANKPPGISPMSYKHNRLIHILITEAKQKAWARLSTHPDVLNALQSKALIEASIYNRRKGRYQRSRNQYDDANQLLEMKNK